MNERIKDLTKQAVNHALDVCDANGLYQGKEYLEVVRIRFAELLILEMCSFLDKAQWDKGEDWCCADGTRIIPAVKEHFGIK